MQDRWTQDHDVAEDTAIGAFEEVKAKYCLAASRLPSDNRRMGVGGSNDTSGVSDTTRGASLVDCRDESAILNVKLCVHDDVEIDV